MSHSPLSGRNRNSLRVLVAEDNPINQRMATTALKSLGHSGVVVGDGALALRCLSQQSFDLILMDVMMPNLDGLEALAAIRASEDPRLSRLPVLMVTAHDLPGDRERFIAAGASGYVAKPVRADALQTEIARVLN